MKDLTEVLTKQTEGVNNFDTISTGVTLSIEEALNKPLGKFFEENDNPVILIDSDTIVYRTAAVTDGRQYLIGKHAFKYKSDVVKYCQENELNVDDIEEVYIPEPKKNAIKILDISIHKIVDYAKSVFKEFNMEFYHTSKENFRDKILPTYKNSRVDKRKPHHLKNLKDSISRRFHEITKAGYEADDLIGIRAYELRDKGIPYIIVSNDKDMKTIPGRHYDWTTGESFKSDEVEAMKFFYAQTIAGDSTDDIPGVSGLGVNTKGTGRAQKIIQEATEWWYDEHPDGLGLEEHLFNTALDCWLEGGPGQRGSYGCEGLEEIIDKFTVTAQCLYILHREDVTWEIPYCDWRNF